MAWPDSRPRPHRARPPCPTSCRAQSAPARESRALPCATCPAPSVRQSRAARDRGRSEEHTSELQSLMRISYAVFCLKKKNKNNEEHKHITLNIKVHTQPQRHKHTQE